MKTQLVDDRQLQVEEILGAFDLPVGGTFSGVAYGGSFIPSGTGASIETRDPSTGKRPCARSERERSRLLERHRGCP